MTYSHTISRDILNVIMQKFWKYLCDIYQIQRNNIINNSKNISIKALMVCVRNDTNTTVCKEAYKLLRFMKIVLGVNVEFPRYTHMNLCAFFQIIDEDRFEDVIPHTVNASHILIKPFKKLIDMSIPHNQSNYKKVIFLILLTINV